MKKGLRKLLCASIVGVSVLSSNCVAYASGEGFIDENTKTYNCSGNLKWVYNSYYNCWNFGDNVNEEQFRNNCWVYDNGKWYYIGENGRMVSNMVLYTRSGNYYMQEDGSMLANGYATPKTGSGQYAWNVYADASGKLTSV